MKLRIALLYCALLLNAVGKAQTIPAYVPTNGLVGWWPFNGNANDESGNGNNGVVTGATLVADRFGVTNRAYAFDGSRYIQTPVGVTGSNPRAISLWIKPTASATFTIRRVIAGYFGGGNAGSDFALCHFESNPSAISYKLGMDIRSSYNVFNPAPTFNAWQHVLINYSPSFGNTVADIDIYVNGQLLTSIAGQQLPSTVINSGIGQKPFCIGGIGTLNQSFNGHVDDVAFFNRALNPIEIQQLFQSQVPCNLSSNFFAQDTLSGCGNLITLNAGNAGASYAWNTGATSQSINANASGWYRCTVSQGTTCSATDSVYVFLSNALPANLQSGLVGYWPFCGNANDESGNGNNGTVNGAVLTTDRFGKTNNAFLFNGINTSITVPTANELEIQGDITLSVWKKSIGHTGNYETFLTKRNVNGEWNYALGASHYFGPGGCPQEVDKYYTGRRNYSGAQYQLRFSNSFVSDDVNVWTHVLVCIVSDTAKFYLNGNLLGYSCFSSPFTIPAIDVAAPLTIGSCNCGLSEFFNGTIDDIAIWNRALSAAEVQQLYAAQSQNPTAGGSTALATNFPTGIAYQAVARDSTGQVLSNTSLGLRFTLRDSSLNGPVVYTETHTLTTSSLGLFSTSIGSGTPVLGAYASVNWMGPQKFLSVELNTGTGYQMLGNQQLLSVPYANVSGASATLKNAALPVFPDNAAAIAGGLLPGSLYRTSLGVLMIVY